MQCDCCYLKMSEEFTDSVDTDLDPRIQIELEKLNTTTDEINKLELEYDVSCYCLTIGCVIRRLVLLIGSKHDFSLVIE